MVHAYWSTILSVDDSVGRLRAWLEESGQLENTIIVFVGDNGLLEGEHGMVDKRTMHEPSIRIPMAVRYAGLTKDPRIVDQQVLTVDMAPSLLELAGAPSRSPASMDAPGSGSFATAAIRTGARAGSTTTTTRRNSRIRRTSAACEPKSGSTSATRMATDPPTVISASCTICNRIRTSASNLIQSSGLQRHRPAAANRAQRADGRRGPDAANRQDASRRGHQEGTAGAEYSIDDGSRL